MNYADFFIPENPADAPLLESAWAGLARPNTTSLWYPSSNKDLSPLYWLSQITRPVTTGSKTAQRPPFHDYESARAALETAREEARRLRKEMEECERQGDYPLARLLERHYEVAREKAGILERLNENFDYEGNRRDPWGLEELRRPLNWDELRESGTLPEPEYFIHNSYEGGYYESAGRRLLETGRPVSLRPPNYSTSYHTRDKAQYVLNKYAPFLRGPALPHYEPNKRSRKLGAYLEITCRDEYGGDRNFKLVYFNYDNLLFYRNALHPLGWQPTYLCGVCCGIWEGGNYAAVCELAENETALPGENPRHENGHRGRPFSLIRALRPAYVITDVFFYNRNGSNYWERGERNRLEESGLAYSSLTRLGKAGYYDAFLYQMRYGAGDRRV